MEFYRISDAFGRYVRALWFYVKYLKYSFTKLSFKNYFLLNLREIKPI